MDAVGESSALQWNRYSRTDILPQISNLLKCQTIVSGSATHRGMTVQMCTRPFSVDCAISALLGKGARGKGARGGTLWHTVWVSIELVRRSRGAAWWSAAETGARAELWLKLKLNLQLSPAVCLCCHTSEASVCLSLLLLLYRKPAATAYNLQI